MKRASVTETKNRLSALLERVRQGETILIEDRGVAVAQIVPVRPGRDRAAKAAERDVLARLERQGIIRPPEAPGPARVLLTPPPRPPKPMSLSRHVIDERREGR